MDKFFRHKCHLAIYNSALIIKCSFIGPPSWVYEIELKAHAEDAKANECGRMLEEPMVVIQMCKGWEGRVLRSGVRERSKGAINYE